MRKIMVARKGRGVPNYLNTYFNNAVDYIHVLAINPQFTRNKNLMFYCLLFSIFLPTLADAAWASFGDTWTVAERPRFIVFFLWSDSINITLYCTCTTSTVNSETNFKLLQYQLKVVQLKCICQWGFIQKSTKWCN